MANKKISELEENSNIQDGCCFPIVSDGATKKIKFATIKAKIDTLLGITSHISSRSNPHKVTAAQVGTYSSGTIDSLLLKKVNAEEGKGLMSDDEKTKLSGLENYDDTEIKAEIASTAVQIKRITISSGADLNTLDMGEGTTASDFKLFVSTASSITKTLLNLPPNFPYNGFSLEYIRISGQQWLQRITGATYSSSGNVTSMTVYYRAGVGIQPTVTWGGWFMISPTACSTTNTTEV